MKFAVFIDYDNLSERHKLSGILDVVTKALLQIPLYLPGSRGTCDVRIYGGWYEGPTMTRRAQDLAVAIAAQFPAIIRIQNHTEVLALSANAQLAVAMMEEPSHPLFGTYRKKGTPGNIRVHLPPDVGCVDTSCPLPLAKKLIKTGKCPIPSCNITTNNLVYRHEQKLVDTMLACDMVYAPTQDYNHLILVSGDDDFLPPLRTVLLRGMPVARFHPKPNALRTALTIHGARLIDLDL